MTYKRAAGHTEEKRGAKAMWTSSPGFLRGVLGLTFLGSQYPLLGRAGLHHSRAQADPALSRPGTFLTSFSIFYPITGFTASTGSSEPSKPWTMTSRGWKTKAETIWCVDRRFKPPDHDRHHCSSKNISRPHPLPEIFHETGADLGACFGAGLVGAGLSFHGTPPNS